MFSIQPALSREKLATWPSLDFQCQATFFGIFRRVQLQPRWPPLILSLDIRNGEYLLLRCSIATHLKGVMVSHRISISTIAEHRRRTWTSWRHWKTYSTGWRARRRNVLIRPQKNLTASSRMPYRTTRSTTKATVTNRHEDIPQVTEIGTGE